MKRSTRLIAFAALTLLVTIEAPRAQEIDFSDEPMVIEGSPENAERMANAIRIADNAILDYVTRSTQSIQQGHRQGFADFRDWYRTRRAEEADREATEAMLRSMIGSALGAGLNFVFPGSGTFVTILKSVSTAAYDAASEQIGSVNSGDVNMFLDRHQAALEGVITELLEVPESFRERGGEELEAAKWEFVFEAMDRESEGETPSSEVGPRTRRLLSNMGVPEPGPTTANVYRTRVLTRQIYAIFSQDRNLRISWVDWEMQVGAEASARRHIYPGQPDRYCPIETQLGNFFWSNECREWRNQ